MDTIETRTETAYLQDFATDLNRLRSVADLHDVILIVEGKRFPANKIVLAAGSAYFQTMFTTDVMEKSQEEVALTLTPECATPEIFGVILEFIYSGKIHLSDDNCYDVLTLGSYLQVKNLAQVRNSVTAIFLFIFIRPSASCVIDQNKNLHVLINNPETI